ncbi:MAG: CPBP family intramembrane glutamic endopeptidase [Fibrobacterota bacterium]
MKISPLLKKFVFFTYLVSFSLVLIFLASDAVFSFTEKFGRSMVLLGSVYMFVPLGVSFILLRNRGKTLREYGARFNFSPSWTLVFLLQPLIMVLTVIVSMASGAGTFDPEYSGFMEKMREQMNEENFEKVKNQLEKAGPFLMFIQAFLMGITINAVFAFGEEMGWRGLMFKELENEKFIRKSVFIGAVWGVWHFPLILMGHNFPEHNIVGVPVMIISCILLSVFITFAREKTGSVFAAAVFHGLFNALAGYPIILIKGAENIVKNPLGISGIAAMIIMAVPLLLYMKNNGNSVRKL